MTVDWIDIKLPSARHIWRFTMWGTGRVVFSVWVFTLDGSMAVLKVVETVLKWTKQGTLNLVRVYDQLPYQGTYGQTIIDTTATVVTEPENIVTNLVAVLDGKHALIIGDTGTGKSTIAQYLAYQIGGSVTVYDPDAAPDEWQGLNVIGRGGDFNAIAIAMTSDLEDLQARVELRGTEGDRALAGKESITIAEEFPLLADEVEVATNWLLKHARRGRKPKRFVIALSQDDSVKALRIEGEGAVRKCFRMVRLGKFAVSYAKSLKDSNLEQWLKDGSYRCMVDDYPCQLPDLSQFRAVTQQLRSHAFLPPSVTAETTIQSGLQPTETTDNQISGDVARAVKACLDAGLSESKVIKEVLGYQGARYQQGKELLEKLKG